MDWSLLACLVPLVLIYGVLVAILANEKRKNRQEFRQMLLWYNIGLLAVIIIVWQIQTRWQRLYDWIDGSLAIFAVPIAIFFLIRAFISNHKE